MNATLIRPDTCQTCPFKVRKGQKLECHGAAPTAQAITAADDKTVRIVGVATIWPEVEPDNWCALHPKRKAMLAEALA